MANSSIINLIIISIIYDYVPTRRDTTSNNNDSSLLPCSVQKLRCQPNHALCANSIITPPLPMEANASLLQSLHCCTLQPSQTLARSTAHITHYLRLLLWPTMPLLPHSKLIKEQHYYRHHQIIISSSSIGNIVRFLAVPGRLTCRHSLIIYEPRILEVVTHVLSEF